MRHQPYNSAPLSALRRSSKYPTLDALAAVLEVSPAIVSGAERGTRQVSDDFLKRHAAAVGRPFAIVRKLHYEARARHLTEEAKWARAQIDAVPSAAKRARAS